MGIAGAAARDGATLYTRDTGTSAYPLTALKVQVMTGRVRIGISGWRYAGWRGVFYPPKLAQARELKFASRRVQSIEINGSHYSLQRASNWRAWRDATPDKFVFSVKGPRHLTHMRRFHDETAIPAMANFFASGLLGLGEKLGPFLWQFPPSFAFHAEDFERFLTLLPKGHLPSSTTRESSNRGSMRRGKSKR